TSTRTNKLATSLSTFATILSNLDIDGPQHLLSSRLKDHALKIGQGTQFVVYKDLFSAEPDDRSTEHDMGKGVVIKRVRISKAALDAEKNLNQNEQYKQTLRHLELEVLSLGLLRHRNIVRLKGWGYDYEDRYTPIPILFMEAAIASLSEILLEEKNREGNFSTHVKTPWHAQYHLALDVAAGLEAIHDYNIIHGDVKPDNVLVFRHDHPNIPFVGKLSDFGVCIDMRSPEQEITPETYLGTEAWTGSEVGPAQWHPESHGDFYPDLLKHFDSYSFGMLLLATFASHGDPPKITRETNPERDMRLSQEIDQIMGKSKGIPDQLIKMIKEVAVKLLAMKPSKRPLPSSSLLQSDLEAYQMWLKNSTEEDQGRKHVSQKGHSYWFKLDMNVLRSMDQQYNEQMASTGRTNLTGETLFGMAEACSQQPIEDRHGRVLKYVLAAAQHGNVPAQAVCRKLYEAHDTHLDVDEPRLIEWEKNAVKNGFLFASHPFTAPDSYQTEKELFRSNGGYCSDAVLAQDKFISLARDPRSLSDWASANAPDLVIDSCGNTMQHVCAALGEIETLRSLLMNASSMPANDAGETPLYKACQAGHSAIVQLLLERGCSVAASASTDATPLHWLFAFPEPDIPRVAEALIQAGCDVNAIIHPVREYGRAQRNLSMHFPFEWPLGSPLHWAAFARNKTAMDVLLKFGANINATYDNGQYATCPLAQVVYVCDALLVEYFISKGANVVLENEQNRNLLHIMSTGQGNHYTLSGENWDSWIRHGSYANKLHAAKAVVHLLVSAGVNLEAKASTYGHYTPLLSAANSTFRKEEVVEALLDAGADTAAVNVSENLSVLHAWCDMEPEVLQYPHAYNGILQKIISKTKDLDLKGGPLEETAMQMLVRRNLPTAQMLGRLDMLLADPSHRTNINVRGRDGDEVISIACSAWHEGMEDRLMYLLEHGASPTAMNDYQENFAHSLAKNYSLMDEDSFKMMQLLSSHGSFSSEARERFATETDPKALIDACTDGRLKTVELLLKLGFSARINEKTTIRGAQTTALDQTILAADVARLTYIQYASELLTDEEIVQADLNNQLYTTNAGVLKNTYGGPSAERAREAYWSFPAIILLLQQHGAKRTHFQRYGPNWTDATKLPQLGMKKDTQPNLAHWKPLYDLEGEWADFEKSAWEEFKEQY
ncbi:hypothetical protein EJ04DRAFT_390945, partial [Polyplosphaeria fusca]